MNANEAPPRGLLIANRGEIACRIAMTAAARGFRTIAVYSDADRDGEHVRVCDEAYRLGPGPAGESYLDVARVLEVAARARAWGIHPGYGFLSERPDFAERCEREGYVFVGPPAESMRVLGDKARAKRLLEPHGIPFVPGYHGESQSDDAFVAAAATIGYPLLVKAAAGGGGRGMRRVDRESELLGALSSARAEALAAFGDGTLLLERLIERPRHIEIQIAADAFGAVQTWPERECSVQRRYQKIIEESPSSAVDEALRERLRSSAARIAALTAYRGIGTIEFLLDERGAFYFIEANTRLQVEHGVTELLHGDLDLVGLQLAIADGKPLSPQEPWSGHAIEVRVCAENPQAGFAPETGTVVCWRPPLGLRHDDALADGAVVSEFYDSLLAKLMVWGETRDQARRSLVAGLDSTVLLGVRTNAESLRAILSDDAFARGDTTTAFLNERAEALAAAQPRDRELAAVLVAVFSAELAARAFGSAWAWWSAGPRFATTFAFVDPADDAPFDVSLAPAHCDATIGSRVFSVELRAIDGLDEGSRVRVFVTERDTNAAASTQPPIPREFRVAYATTAEVRYLAIGAATYAFRDRSAGAHDADHDVLHGGVLRAPTGGRVLAINVAAGSKVSAQSVGVVLEAMKIEHAVAFPNDAVVAEVIAKTGDRVERGTPLVRFEPVSAMEPLEGPRG